MKNKTGKQYKLRIKKKTTTTKNDKHKKRKKVTKGT